MTEPIGIVFIATAESHKLKPIVTITKTPRPEIGKPSVYLSHFGSPLCRKIISNYSNLPDDIKKKYDKYTPDWIKNLCS